ncbi:imidazole glycerol phosphate synthase subunit HisF [Candidatus Woesearchaeota archaeon]|nr:imidazole glycerol phosphate synthase subunit HisF [Candidatus Woesearchaeota archaeon]
MKKKRIIARLDIKGPNVVKGVQFECLRVMGKPAQLAEEYYLQGADELLYLDTVANLYRRDNLLTIVHQASENIFIPFTVGGGIRTIEDIKALLLGGAERVAINTAAVQNPSIISKASRIFGSQCIVVSIEAKKKFDETWEPYIDNGRQKTGLDAVTWARRAEALGAGEIIITSVDREGTKRGLDIGLIKAVSEAVSVPVIAAGGAGALEDFFQCFKKTRADAVATASLLHYKNYGIVEIKDYLHREMIPVRLVPNAKRIESNHGEEYNSDDYNKYTAKYNLDDYNKYTTKQIEEEYVDVGIRKSDIPENYLNLSAAADWEIGVIDYGINNVKSVVKSLEKLNQKVKRIIHPEELLKARALVLPGVGAFREGMKALEENGLIYPLLKRVAEGIPILGICLGMQLFFTESEEFGIHKGLNLIPGRVVPFKSPKEVKIAGYSVPHIGWNKLRQPARSSAPWSKDIFSTLSPESTVYFVHSYYPQTEREYVIATSAYGGQEFASIVQKKNVFGTQFHPEKSGEIGLKILQSFCNQQGGGLA